MFAQTQKTTTNQFKTPWVPKINSFVYHRLHGLLTVVSVEDDMVTLSNGTKTKANTLLRTPFLKEFPQESVNFSHDLPFTSSAAEKFLVHLRKYSYYIEDGVCYVSLLFGDMMVLIETSMWGSGYVIYCINKGEGPTVSNYDFCTSSDLFELKKYMLNNKNLEVPPNNFCLVRRKKVINN